MSTAPPPPSLSTATERTLPVAAWWHTALLVSLLGLVSYWQGRPVNVAAASRLPSRIPVYIATAIFELFLFLYVWLLGLLPRRVSIREIIGGRWARFSDFLIDVAVALLFNFSVWTVIGLMALLLRFSGAKAAQPLIPQNASEVVAFVMLSMTAGFCEEFIFRGYLQRQFLALTQAPAAAIAMQAVVFGAAHFYQGWQGMLTITIYGVLFGVLAWLRKSLRPGMMQHAGQDAFSGVVIYLATKYHLVKLA